MLDDKKIEEAAWTELSKQLSRPTISQEEVDEYGKDMFIIGAHWAIGEFLKSLWHDAKEEPSKYKDILTINNVGATVITWRALNPIYGLSWEDIIKKWKYTKWLYIDDLLPKQKGGSNERA